MMQVKNDFEKNFSNPNFLITALLGDISYYSYHFLCCKQPYYVNDSWIKKIKSKLICNFLIINETDRPVVDDEGSDIFISKLRVRSIFLTKEFCPDREFLKHLPLQKLNHQKLEGINSRRRCEFRNIKHQHQSRDIYTIKFSKMKKMK